MRAPRRINSALIAPSGKLGELQNPVLVRPREWQRCDFSPPIGSNRSVFQMDYGGGGLKLEQKLSALANAIRA